MKRLVIICLSLLIIVSGIFITQKKLSLFNQSHWRKESMSYLPGDARIGNYLLGYKVTVSHFLWIKTMIYFGGHYITDKQYTWLVNMIDIITKLNPNFYPAYEFAGVLLPDITKNPGISQIILERGLSQCSVKKWNIAFYQGMLYYKYYNDYLNAARYIELASKAPGAPKEKLVGLAATFYRNSGLNDYALSYLKFMYETADNPEVKRHILEKIKLYISKNR